MYKDKLKQACKDAIEKHPTYKSEIYDLYQLALDEIESGESAENEYNIFVNAVEDLTNDENGL